MHLGLTSRFIEMKLSDRKLISAKYKEWQRSSMGSRYAASSDKYYLIALREDRTLLDPPRSSGSCGTSLQDGQLVPVNARSPE